MGDWLIRVRLIICILSELTPFPRCHSSKRISPSFFNIPSCLLTTTSRPLLDASHVVLVAARVISFLSLVTHANLHVFILS